MTASTAAGTAVSSSSSSSIDERLATLESTLGLTSSTATPSRQLGAGVEVQVQSLLESTNGLLQRYHTTQQQKQQQQQQGSSSSSSSSNITLTSLEQTLIQCERLFKSFESSSSSSGLIMMSTPSSNDVYTTAPLIYRRQEVLARNAELERALEQLGSMRDLLCLSNPSLMKEIQKTNANLQSNSNSSSSSSSSSLLDHVSNAPIISSPSFTFATEEENKKRLEDVTAKVIGIHDKAEKLSRKCDDIINVYYKLMTAVNEKLVLYHDER